MPKRGYTAEEWGTIMSEVEKNGADESGWEKTHGVFNEKFPNYHRTKGALKAEYRRQMQAKGSNPERGTAEVKRTIVFLQRMAARMRRLRRENMVLVALKEKNRALKKENRELLQELARTRKLLRQYTRVIETAKGALVEHSKK